MRNQTSAYKVEHEKKIRTVLRNRFHEINRNNFNLPTDVREVGTDCERCTSAYLKRWR